MLTTAVVRTIEFCTRHARLVIAVGIALALVCGAYAARNFAITSDINALLENYQASIVDGAKGGMFRLQFGSRALGKDEVSNLMTKLQGEKIINLAVPTP